MWGYPRQFVKINKKLSRTVEFLYFKLPSVPSKLHPENIGS